MERTGLKKRALTPKQALIAPSFLSLLLSIEFSNSNIYIIHNQISSSSLLLAIIPLLLFRNNYFIFLDGHIRKAYYGTFTPLILYGVVLVISIKKSEPISQKKSQFILNQTIRLMVHSSLYSYMAVLSSFIMDKKTSIFSYCPGSLLDFFQVSVLQ